MRTFVVSAAVVLLLFGVGCGGDDEGESQAAAEQVVVDFFDTYRTADGQSFCDLITVQSAELVAAEFLMPCPDAFRNLGGADSEVLPIPDGDVEVGNATVDGGTATVPVSGLGPNEAITLTQENGEWKVDLDAERKER